VELSAYTLGRRPTTKGAGHATSQRRPAASSERIVFWDYFRLNLRRGHDFLGSNVLTQLNIVWHNRKV
jgi:hypothetical protein